jgi:L-asparaginase II
MVAGTGRFCTAFIRAGDGRWVGKAGAEGMYGIALAPPNPLSQERGVGIVLKVADGDRRRSPQVPHEHGLKVQWIALGKILGDAGLLDENVKAHLEPFLEARRYNWRGAHVGFVEPVFELERSDG